MPTNSRARFLRATDSKLDHNPLWDHKAECAFPSATQNEINAKDAANLLSNGVYVVSEGANMPTRIDGVNQFLEAKILFGPGRPRTPAGSRPRVSRWRKTACAFPGRARKSTRASSTS